MSILSNLKPNEGSTKKRKRLGRGQGSGQGLTAGKGEKGQTARSGGRIRRGFEGGQMPLHRRVPKRGFKNIWAIETATVTLKTLQVEFPEGGEVTLEACIEKGIASANSKRLKVLGTGEINAKYTVTAYKVTQKAVDAIENNGGSVSILDYHSPFARVKLGEITKKFGKKDELVKVTVAELKAAGLVPNYKDKVEIVAVGTLNGRFHIEANKVSREARKVIETRGGKVTVIDPENHYRNISFSDLRKWFPKGGDITPEILTQKGIIAEGRRVSLVDKGRLYGVYNVTLHKVSKAARVKIEAKGGEVTLLG